MIHNFVNTLSFCILIILTSSLNFHTLAQTSKPDNIMNRKAAVAGRFYAGDKSQLTNDVQNLFNSAKAQKSDAIAVISPHAGYVFSGQVAASAINQIDKTKNYKNVFILATSHTAYYEGASIYNLGNYETPLGEVKVNIELANDLISKYPIFTYNAAAHKTEHSVEVQLPLLQMHLGENFQIVPIVIGQDGAQTAKSIAEALMPYFNDDNIFVISSDFSHYPEYADALTIDNETAEAIVSGNPDNLLAVIEKYQKSKIENLATTCCGWSSVLTLMYLTVENHKYHLIDYKNSGDSQYGSKDRVVGYWAISVSKLNNDDSSYKLSDEEKKQLLELARHTVETRVVDGKKPDISSWIFNDNLSQHCGAFVTLHKDSNLRGCIGRFEPNIPLYQVVVEMAISAAMSDPRFTAVTKAELEEIDIEISVLTPMKKINSVDEIVLGKHGIYIMKNGRGGTFLPQVATETGWTLEEFLGHCARDKAGIGYTGWKEADIYTYEAIIFSEKDFGLFPKKKTKYYTKLDGDKVECTLCPHSCILSSGQIGACNARKNINGELQSLTYGKIVAINIDPVEKKPLYHFQPGSTTMSFGTAGCNLHCKNCQNSTISQANPETIDFTTANPEQIIATALKNNCKSISYTYTEPTIFYEYMLETAKLAHASGLKNIIVSNGFINPEPLLELIPYLDAANIDLKCFNDSIYRKMTTAGLEPVLNTIKTLKENGVWLEITNLVIPGWSDDLQMISQMCDWLVANGFEEVPLHFSRFHPSYKMLDVQATPAETLEQAYNIAKEKGIKYVYLGNLRSDKTNTFCPACAETVIERVGFSADKAEFNGICKKCGFKINGIWD